MAVFSSPIYTNEGRALMADIIANQGTAVFKEAWLSSTNYVGSEETLTAATFTGTFLVDNDISASIYDSTVIGTEVSVDNSTLLVDQNLYTIGIILDDNGTDVLLCVSTTSSPEPIPAFVDNPIKFAYQFMLTVSSTQNIQVVGSLAGVVYKSDIRNVLTSSESDKPLSANMGRLIDNKILFYFNDFVAKSTTFNLDGTITETDADGYTVTTTFTSDTVTTQVLKDSNNVVLATKTITIGSSTITEVLS